MALATRCPHCGTTFRVAQDQLKLRAGVVRCGTCKQIFNGIESLVAPDTAEPGKAAPADAAKAEAPWRTAPVVDTNTATPWRAPADEAAPVPAMGPKPLAMPAADAIPARGARSAGAASSPNIRADAPVAPADPAIGQAAAPGPAKDGAASPRDAVTDDAPLDLDFNIGDDAETPEQARLHAPPAEPAPEPEAAPPADAGEDYTVDLAGPQGRGNKRAAERARLRQQRLHAGQDGAPPAAPAPVAEAELADDEVPDFVRRARRQSRGATLRRRVMLAGVPLLLLLLLGQGAYLFRDRLAASLPQAKPLLVRACAALACRVGFPAQIDMVSLESQELQTLPNGSLLLASVLRNRSALVQAWPHLELTLTDSADKPLARRVFRPEDYVADAAELAKGLAPRAEAPVKVYLDAAQVKASGYRVYIFYP
jgi:predicted Zn finger-like uncharacterized protein